MYCSAMWKSERHTRRNRPRKRAGRIDACHVQKASGYPALTLNRHALGAGMLWHVLLGMSFSLLERRHTLLSTPACKQLWRQESGQLHRSLQLETGHPASYDACIQRALQAHGQKARTNSLGRIKSAL